MSKKIFCYQHNIEKYDAATVGMSLIEHGAYRRLLDAYYKSGAELPNDIKQLYIICSCQGKAERDAVAYAAARFFSVGDDGFLRQSGAEIEMKRILKISEEQRRKANIMHNKNNHIQHAAACAAALPLHMPETCQLSTINNQLSSKQEESLYVESPKISNLEISVDFEIFWNTYPKQVGYKEAMKQYKIAREKGTSHATIIDGVRKFIEVATGTDDRFIPNPARWLEEWRWNDKPTRRTQNAGSSPNGRTAYGDSLANAARIVSDKIRNDKALREKTDI